VRIIKITADVDWEVHLECVCADDFGAYYSHEETDENSAHAAQYDETRATHQRLQALAKEHGIRHYIADTDDQDSKHSDAYLYFRWSELEKVMAILSESGAQGDILDVPRGFPVSLRAIARQQGWSVEETL
jgi:hypothetical protein